MLVVDKAIAAFNSPKPMILVRGIKAIIRGIKSAFGGLATGAFWLDLSRLVVKTMVNAFVLTIGGKFVSYVRSQEAADGRQTAQTPASSAFSQGYTPTSGHAPRNDYSSRTDYRGSYAPSQPVSPAAAVPFPGW